MYDLLQGSVGETDSEQTSPLGAPHHLHWAYQEPPVQVLESRVCSLCTRDREVSNRTCAKLSVSLMNLSNLSSI